MQRAGVQPVISAHSQPAAAGRDCGEGQAAPSSYRFTPTRVRRIGNPSSRLGQRRNPSQPGYWPSDPHAGRNLPLRRHDHPRGQRVRHPRRIHLDLRRAQPSTVSEPGANEAASRSLQTRRGLRRRTRRHRASGARHPREGGGGCRDGLGSTPSAILGTCPHASPSISWRALI
jgi:hypothetical protein